MLGGQVVLNGDLETVLNYVIFYLPSNVKCHNDLLQQLLSKAKMKLMWGNTDIHMY